MKPRPLPKAAAQIVADLTSGLSEAVACRTIDNGSRSAKPVFVAQLGPTLFMIGYYDPNDGVSTGKPWIQLVRRNDGWYLYAFERPATGPKTVLTIAEDGAIETPAQARIEDAFRFANTLLRDIKRQQGSLRP